VPKAIPSCSCVTFYSVSYEQNVALALSWSGEIFSWGSGKNGMLGHSDKVPRHEPTRIDALSGERMLSVTCGAEQCLAINSRNELYQWGILKRRLDPRPVLPTRCVCARCQCLLLPTPRPSIHAVLLSG